jgi:NADPH2:quinone reductase
MLAIRIDELGGPDVLRPVEVPVPVIGPSELLVRHEWVGVNYVDTQHREGTPYPVTLPLIPGIEAAGTVAAVGAAVRGYTLGDRVAYAGPMVGVYAELAAVPEAVAVAVPDGLATRDAAAVLLQGMTAHMVTHDVRAGSPGAAALVHAAAGGTGSLVVQYLIHQGATVLATASSPAKAAYIRSLGVEHVLASRDPDLARAVRDIVPGGVDVVYDSVGRSTFETTLRVLRTGGLIVAFGQSSGPVPPIDIARLSGLTGEGLPGSLWLTWPTLSDHNATRDALVGRAAAVFEAVLDGVLQPSVAATFPLRDAARAHERLASREVIGKILLEV